MRKNRITKGQKLVQTRIMAKTLRELERQAERDGTSVAAILRGLAEQHVTMGRSLYQRVRAIEVSLVNFGVVPDGVVQPLDAEGDPDGLLEVPTTSREVARREIMAKKALDILVEARAKKADEKEGKT